jgi:Zn-dependent M28 family amino/carboxypeptidase
MLPAVADAMALGPLPARSVLFIFMTGEERGLLGSDYFAAHRREPATAAHDRDAVRRPPRLT